jgi:hypothetical protein
MSGLIGKLVTASPLITTGAQIARSAGVDFGPVAFLLGNQRKIDTIVPDVVITEHHVDRMQITQHPVIKGAPVSDHAFMLPKTVTMQCGFSNSNVLQAAMSGFSSGGGFSDIGGGLLGAGTGLLGSFTEQRVKDIYDKLRAIQEKATKTGGSTIKVMTGKRSYENMMISEISVTTDRHSEFALFITVSMQEIIMVQEAKATAPSSSDMPMPGKTAPVVPTGAPQLNPLDSALSRGSDFFKKLLPSWLISPTAGAGGGATPAPPHLRLGGR